jgi:hypothetical protein
MSATSRDLANVIAILFGLTAAVAAAILFAIGG